MEYIKYNEQVILGYEHEPIYASANAILGTKFRTKVYLIQGRSRYPLGTEDGKLDEETIKDRFTETIGIERERQYGQQTGMLRKELTPVRDRGQITNQRRKGFTQEPAVGDSSITRRQK